MIKLYILTAYLIGAVGFGIVLRFRLKPIDDDDYTLAGALVLFWPIVTPVWFFLLLPYGIGRLVNWKRNG